MLTPHRFVFSKPFALIFTLYTGTYLTANSIDTATATLSSRPSHVVTAGPAKFIATSGANLGLCLWKDSHFTRMFGAPSSLAPRGVPSLTYALFAFRDCLTIFASFNVPPLLAPHIPMHHLPSIVQKSVDKASIAQFIAPAAVQIFSTPVHLLGLDVYNQPTQSLSERWRTIKRLWGWSCIARVGRIVPAFGVGGVVNNGVRRRLMMSLDQRPS